jgi:hypothetical protein
MNMTFVASRPGTAHRIDGGRELGQEVVAGAVHDPAAVLLDEARDLPPVRAEPANDLVVGHEPAVPDHVGREDRREPAFGGVRGHGHFPNCSFPARAYTRSPRVAVRIDPESDPTPGSDPVPPKEKVPEVITDSGGFELVAGVELEPATFGS